MEDRSGRIAGIFCYPLSSILYPHSLGSRPLTIIERPSSLLSRRILPALRSSEDTLSSRPLGSRPQGFGFDAEASIGHRGPTHPPNRTAPANPPLWPRSSDSGCRASRTSVEPARSISGNAAVDLQIVHGLQTAVGDGDEVFDFPARFHRIGRVFQIDLQSSHAAVDGQAGLGGLLVMAVRRDFDGQAGGIDRASGFQIRLAVPPAPKIAAFPKAR